MLSSIRKSLTPFCSLECRMADVPCHYCQINVSEMELEYEQSVRNEDEKELIKIINHLKYV